MKVEDAIKYLGYPHENAEFGAYLSSVGIEERPLLQDSPMVSCKNAKQGFVFVFGSRSTYEEYQGPAVEGGDMIFEKIQLLSEDATEGVVQYKHDIPFGIKFSMGIRDLVDVLGEPNMSHPSGPENTVYRWFNVNKLALSVCLLPGDKGGISFLSIGKSELRDI